MTVRPYRVFLGAGLAASAVYFALPRGSGAQAALYDGIGFAAAAAIACGAWVQRPASRLPWLLFALGNAASAVGDVIATVLNDPPVPSAADVAYLAAYPLLAAGLVLLLVRAGGHHRTAPIVEAAIVTCAFALVQWIFIVEPIVDGGGATAERAVSAAYPSMDIVLLAALAGFFATAAWRTPSFLLLVAGVVPLLAADEIYALTAQTYSSGAVVDVGWLLSYVLWGTAALHPSMRELSEPRPRFRQLRIHPLRIALLLAALLAAPAVLLTQHVRGAQLSVPAVVAASAVIASLVVMRLVGILRALERIRARLVEADRVKDEFVALISHDLRTPLTSVMGYIELALDDDLEPPLDAERRGYLDVVSRSSQRLLRLVDDLLFVARLQAGRLDLTPTALDLRELAHQAAEEARRRASAKGVELVFEGNGPVRVDADKGRMFQLLDNLVSNAIKFTPEGGRVEVAVSANGSAVLEVRDTGIGFTEEEAARVFDRFFRTDAAVDGQVPGTGLGLYIAQAITEAHGGRITAAPRSGGGAVFRIELPRRTA
ncbi:MAG TPA: HAMP domain-containing sensor histidine kinase [Gaiellaceae bacterium]|nr:HAMP domain-containing sensor histidine kinase [Gaiellaceae bacterium]